LQQVFSIRQRFWMRQVLASTNDFGCTKFLASAKDFQGANVFGCANVLYIFCGAYIFAYFSAFLFSMRHEFHWRKCFKIFRLSLIIVVMIMYCVS
jgi:hypothetical protein